jgi:hypothetical protein
MLVLFLGHPIALAAFAGVSSGLVSGILIGSTRRELQSRGASDLLKSGSKIKIDPLPRVTWLWCGRLALAFCMPLIGVGSIYYIVGSKTNAQVAPYIEAAVVAGILLGRTAHYLYWRNVNTISMSSAV